MTVIAWDGKTLAADRRISLEGMVISSTKIQRIGGRLVGIAGTLVQGLEMMHWLEKKGREFPESQYNAEWATVLVIDKGKILLYEQNPIPIPIEEKFFAIGSGSPYAMAAMYCGKSAAEAVEVACKYDGSCGNGIDKLALKDKLRMAA